MGFLVDGSAAASVEGAERELGSLKTSPGVFALQYSAGGGLLNTLVTLSLTKY